MMDPAEGRALLRIIALSSLLLASAGLRADEGMWPFDSLPLAQMKSRYGFAPDQAWLDHLRLATVVFGDQGTGAFVGRDGLLLTNHHVAHASIQRISDRGHDWVRQGFVARTRDEEIRIPGLEIRVLESTRNVTQVVAQALKPGLTTRNAEAALEELKRREAAETGLACELVDFHQGGEYWIYRYRRFSDVRLVMAPEYDIAAFGKEWDNFTYPRHDLDFSLFRVYEQGRPYRSPHALAWTRKGIASGGMTLVAGHPGRTNRLEPWSRLDFRRRIVNPLTVRTLERNLATLAAYAARSEEHARRVSTDLLEAANFLKVYREEVRGLEDPQLQERIQSKEKELRARMDQDPRWRDQASRSWRALEQLTRRQEGLAREYQLMHRLYRSLERGPLAQAVQLVQRINASAPPEAEQPDTPPLDRELETLLLTAGLEEAQEWLGSDHPLPRALLGGRSPKEAASLAIGGTRIDDPAYVRELIAGGPKALERCADPLILLAARLEPRSRAVRQQYEALEAQIREHTARIARARFTLQGKALYPEASFTLRLSFGTVEPYPAEGTLLQPFTTYGGLFDRADAWGPRAESGSWSLPPRWLQRRKALDPSTPLNFITTNDITGGSSGSPVVDQAGDLVGLVFDGNLHNIRGRFYYDGQRNRCIAVDARAILEALAKVYHAEHLVKELTEQ